MACLLRHPDVATRSCESCKQWQYDQDGRIATRLGKPLKRVGLPPCKTCPKESPEKAHEHELNEKNLCTLNLFYVTRAMNGANLPDELKFDPILQRNFSIIDRIVRTYEGESSLLAQMAFLTPAKPKGR